MKLLSVIVAVNVLLYGPALYERATTAPATGGTAYITVHASNGQTVKVAGHWNAIHYSGTTLTLDYTTETAFRCGFEP